MPQSLKLVTVWLLIATALFLAVQAMQHRAERSRFSFDVASGRIELKRAPDGHFSTMAITWARTVDSSVARTCFHTLVTRVPQKPAWTQIDRSSRTCTPTPPSTSARSS